MRSNHTATHVLNYGLKTVLGDAVDQKGSLVSADKLRFDYSCKTGATNEQLVQIESICNDFIQRNLQVYYQDVPLVLAKQLNGLRAVFGEVFHFFLAYCLYTLGLS